MLVETLFGALGALAVLVFVFASFLALVPLMIAAVSILTTFLLVLGLTYLTDVSFVVQFLIALVGLGVAIDYSLLLVSRWREERAHGRSNEEAVVVAVQTAGHAVLASGVTVAISLLALLVVPVPFLRSMGLGGMLIPLVSVAVVLTLLPGDARQHRPAGRLAAHPPRRRRRPRLVGLGARHRRPPLGRGRRRRARCSACSSHRCSRSRSGRPAPSRSPAAARPSTSCSSSRRAGSTNGVLTPIEVLVPAGEAQQAAQLAGQVPGITTAVVGPVRGEYRRRRRRCPSTRRSTATAARSSRRCATRSRAAPTGEVGITGVGAVVSDYFSAVYANFPYVLAIISVITFVLLVRTFRSVLLPIKAVLLNLVSLAAVFGSVVVLLAAGPRVGRPLRRLADRAPSPSGCRC